MLLFCFICLSHSVFVITDFYKQIEYQQFFSIAYCQRFLSVLNITSVNINFCIIKTKENDNKCMFLYYFIVIIFNLTMHMILHDIDRSLDLCSTSLALVTIQRKSDTLMEMYHYFNFK